ncbi:FAD-linked oxidase [Naasia aerilata]|uniref:FAD-linked oxidase n=1 Tax=Naasia aerilata TaxID=1162966 RepID=A0ABN6XL66_9MICO|nr:FAD-linked oxidase [Naasia aerilata]
MLEPGDDAFEELRPAYAMAGEPAVLVRPATAAEVAEAVRFAATVDLPVSVRSGGHGAASFANPGGMVIDLGLLATVDVGEEGVVRIGGGATWGAVAEALATSGLALTSGDTRSVGVGGLTLGGGIGWMVRQYGLALDSLRSAEVVLADGRIVTASAAENPDLFWALRGGGGNFGVVTSFTFQAHSVNGVVFGTLTFGLDDLPGLLRGWRDAMRQAPIDLNSTILAMPAFGDAPPALLVFVCWAGAEEEADEAIAPLRALPGLLADEVAPRAYADILDDPHPPEGPITVVDYNGFTDDFDDATIDTLVEAHAGAGAAVLMLRYLRGALNRVPAEETAFAHRGSEVLMILAAFLGPDAGADGEAAVRRRFAVLDAHTTGAYSNFSAHASADVLARIFPPQTLARLRQVKRVYDPDNLFARNHNIVPAEGAMSATALG